MNSIGLIESKGLVALFEAADYLLKNSPVKILGIKNLNNGYLTLGVAGEKDYVSVAIESAVDAGRKVGEIYASSLIENPTPELLELVKEIFNKEIEKSELKKSGSKKVDIPEFKGESSITHSESLIDKKEITKEKKPLTRKQPLVKPEKKLKEESVTEKSNEIATPVKQKFSSSTIERLRKEALGLASNKKDTKTSKTDEIISHAKVDSKEIDFEAIEKMNVHKLRHYAREFENFPIKGREISRANRSELIELFKKM